MNPSRIEIGGLQCLVAGDANGRKAMLVHGAPGAAADWAQVLRRVPPGQRWHAIERVGYGSEGHGPESQTLGGQAERLADVVEMMAGADEPVVLAGHSYGAAIAARVAALLSPRVAISRLVLVAGVLDPRLGHRRLYHHLMLLPGVRAFVPARYRLAAAEMAAIGPALPCLNEFWPTVNFPVTLIHGTSDYVVSVRNSEYIASQVPADMLRFERISGGGHALPRTHADWVANEISRLETAVAGKGGSW